MRIHAAAVGLLLSFSLLGQEPGETAPLAEPTSKEAWARFQSDSGGQWVAQWTPATGTPGAIWGTGLALAGWRENSLAAARRHAEQLLVDQKDLLGIGASTFVEVIGARMGRTWSFTFDQFFRGLPVIDGRADVRINMNGTVAMFGSRAFPIPENFGTAPVIGEELATAVAWEAVGAPSNGLPQPGQPRQTRLVIWGDVTAQQLAPVFLAWEVPISNLDQNGDGTLGRYYVDANTGRVLHFTNDWHRCTAGCSHASHRAAPRAPIAVPSAPPVLTTVTLMAWTRTGNDGTSPLVNTPLARFMLNVPGVGLVATNASGEITVDIAAPITINVANLDGTHFAPIQGADAPSGSFVVNPGVNTTIQLLTAAATSNQAAHSTAGYWIDRVNEWARATLGNTAQLNTADSITTTVNSTSDTCNAGYGGNSMVFYAAGGGCNNMAFSTVVAHEWGHGLDDRYGGISNSIAEGLSEGWGDIIAMYLTDQPVVGANFSGSSFIRTGNNTRLYPYSSGSSPHGAGEVWMGFGWHARQNLRSAFPTTGVQISNDVVLGSIVADATNRVDAVREVFIADDDDGNLLNGTPHYAQLSAAAITKALPYPEIVYATISHVPLQSTSVRLTPRILTAFITPLSGSILFTRVVFNAGSGVVSRNMQSTGGTGYRALLPGLDSGTVSYHIEAIHNVGGLIRYPEAGEIIYTVDAGGAFTAFYTEGFEGGGPGWVSGTAAGANDWQVGDPAGKSGTSSGVAWADPQNAGGGAFCFGNDLGNGNFNGAYPANVENWLRSPVINCTGRTGVRLRFKRWLTVESGTFDQALVRMNGATVWANSATVNHLDTSWQTVEYVVPAADNNPSVQFEWYLNSDGGLNLGGWQIDDVQLGTVPPPVPLEAELLMTPEQCAQGTPVTFSLQTAGPNFPWFVLLADGPGPSVLPDFPTFSVGGNVTIITGSTDATGNTTIVYPAPSVAAMAGTLTYSQVLTLNASFTAWVVSNQFINLFTINP